MMQLFKNDLRPITTQFGFIKSEAKETAETFITWQTPLVKEFNATFVLENIRGSLRNTLLSLCPLTSIDTRRCLFIPTKSDWVAYFDNNHTGAVPEYLSHIACLLNTGSLRIVNDLERGDVMLDIYGMLNNEFELLRFIHVTKESRWEFNTYGEPLPFEQPEKYTERKIRDRFTPEMLHGYLSALGIDAFDEKFYLTDKALMVSKLGGNFPSTKTFTLEEAQNYFQKET